VVQAGSGEAVAVRNGQNGHAWRAEGDARGELSEAAPSTDEIAELASAAPSLAPADRPLTVLLAALSTQ